MKLLTLALTLAFLSGASTTHAQVGTAFTYQGRLDDAGVPTNGAFDFEFQLFTLAAGGTGSSVVTLGDLNVANGLFTVTLDFGAVFTGSARWLEIRVRPGASTGGYTALLPRQQLTPSPNAVFASTAGAVTGIVPVANGGTGSTTQNFVDLTTAQTVGGDKTLSGNLVLATSTATTGHIMKGASRFIHNSSTNNTFIGVNAGNVIPWLTGNNNTGSGTGALQHNTSGGTNTADGAFALYLNTTGESNTASGASALQNNTSGTSNTADGAFALFNNTSGASNTASGAEALRSNTAGLVNSASGASALFSNTTGSLNTATGAQALFANTTGNSNTASGVNALAGNISGNANTASGSAALLSNTTGEGNTASGTDALLLNTGGASNTALGVAALQTNTTGSENTGLGAGADVATSALTNATAIGSGAVVDASNKIRLGNASVTVIEGQVAYTFPSDRNAKENFRAVSPEAVIEKLRGLDVTTWNYIGHDPKEFRHYGPMAQDFYAAFGRDEVGAIGAETTINSGDILGVLMLGIKGLDRQIQKDQRTIKGQAAEIAGLKQQIAALANLVKTLATESRGNRVALASGGRR